LGWVVFCERGIIYKSNAIRTANSVKLIFDLSGEIPYLVGPLGLLIVTEACHSTHLAKIQGMKSISKPPLRMEIYTYQEIFSTHGLGRKR
jgi:hypothetical protein